MRTTTTAAGPASKTSAGGGAGAVEEEAPSPVNCLASPMRALGGGGVRAGEGGGGVSATRDGAKRKTVGRSLLTRSLFFSSPSSPPPTEQRTMHALTAHRAVHSVCARKSSTAARVAPARARRATRIAPAASAAAAADDVSGDMLSPSIWNTPAARLVTVGAGAVITAAASAAASPALGPAAMHVMSWATGLGTMLYTTFFLGIAMFKNLPRQGEGVVCGVCGGGVRRCEVCGGGETKKKTG